MNVPQSRSQIANLGCERGVRATKGSGEPWKQTVGYNPRDGSRFAFGNLAKSIASRGRRFNLSLCYFEPC